MVNILVVDRAGVEHAIDTHGETTLMEAIRDSQVEGLLALCGGCCSCATCHVYIEQADDAVLPAPGADEDDLLDSTNHRQACSRLSCQIAVRALSGNCKVVIAPED